MRLAPQEIRTFFTTAVTANRRRLFQSEQNAELLLHILQDNRQKDRFQLHAYVIMPDHIHLLMTPAENVSIEKAMQFIKGGFSFKLKSAYDVWERSFKEHRIKNKQDYEHHKTYIEQNPIRANSALFDLKSTTRSYSRALRNFSSHCTRTLQIQ